MGQQGGSLKRNKRTLKLDGNETTKTTTYQNLWDAVKATLRKKCIVLNTHIRKEEIMEIESREEKAIKLKVSRTKGGKN